jgi:ectoine hydroxylase-related dioxygenase (phytanoyl-CoA dioxygenase family)
MSNQGLCRLPDDGEIATFWNDGVVCLRGVLEPDYVLSMASAVERLITESIGTTMHDMTAMGEDLARAGETLLADPRTSGGRFISGIDHWRIDREFAAFACASGVPAIVAALLRSHKLNLWEDSVLVKEPGTRERTAWHQDLSYFHVSGEQVCTTWIPLDQVDAESGAMRFARGSHRWTELYRPNMFVSNMPMAGTVGEQVPDIDRMSAEGKVELLQFDLGPGDMTVHHARMLHAAGGNLRRDRRRRAISLRYCGDDARYHFRPGAPRKAHHEFVQEGDMLDGPDCPLVWGHA